MDVPNYNLVASPMYVYEEDDSLTKQEHEQRRINQLSRQATRSPFIIGSIEELGRKIERLGKFLSDNAPPKLVCESRSPADDDDAAAKGVRAWSAESTESSPHRKKTKEQRDLNRFAGIFSIHSAVQYVPERVRNIHKISLHTKPKKERKTVESSSQPKFVELFTFPGYHSMKLTPLPYGLSATDICDKICSADATLSLKPRYADQFRKLFYSQLSQAVLQDVFWWVFLEKFQSNKKSQVKYFHRIAHNYVKLLIHMNQHCQYKEPFLQSYPNVMSQAVFTTFCEAFPDSYKQFDDNFKEFILSIVYEWLTGCVPTPRKYQSWSHKLEPVGRIREAAMGKTNADQNASKARSTADDWLRSIEQMEAAAKQQAKMVYGSEPSVISMPLSKARRLGSKQDYESSSGDESSIIEKVTKEQSSTLPTSAQALPVAQRMARRDRGVPGDGSRNLAAAGPAVNLSKMLTPVIEVTSPSLDHDVDDSLSRTALLTVASTKVTSKSVRLSKTRKATYGLRASAPSSVIRESHPACKGPDMVPSLFDINGQSPLLAHVLRTRSLAYDSGLKIYVQRTEMKNLPPLNTPTYSDVIRETFAAIRHIEAGVQSHVVKDTKEQARFVLSQIKEAKLYKEKQQALLCDLKEVKRLSNLLMIDHSTKKAERLDRGSNEGNKKDANAKTMLDQVFEEALQNVELSPRSWS